MPNVRPSLNDDLETAWKIINLQADTALKVKQTKHEAAKVVIAAMMMVAGLVALFKLLHL